MPSFFNGKRFFLTYPQCQGTRQELSQFLSSKAVVKYVLVARELHQDGHQHFHACVEYAALQRHDARWLDFNGKHPNVQSPRSWAACKSYCKKDDTDFIEVDLHLDGLEIATEDHEVAEMDLQEKCFSFDKEEDWFAYCATEKISFQYCQYFWNRLHGDLCTIRDDEHEGEICAALDTFQYPGNSRQCLVIRGPSGCGKTTWAKRNMPKPCLFVSHVDQLKLFRTGYHKSIIFDDVSFCHTPRTNQIALVDYDNPRAVHCRHAIANIPARIPKVFTCNEWPVDKSDEAIARRCKFYTIRDWGQLIQPE